MPRGKGIYDNEDTEEPNVPGPKADSGDGGVATREHAPDVDESSEEPTA